MKVLSNIVLLDGARARNFSPAVSSDEPITKGQWNGDVSDPGDPGDGSAIQWQDEGGDLGTPDADTVDFVGAGVTVTRSGNKIIVTIPGATGGGGSDAAADITIVDVGNNYTAANVEAALAEIIAKIAAARLQFGGNPVASIVQGVGVLLTLSGTTLTVTAAGASGGAGDVVFGPDQPTHIVGRLWIDTTTNFYFRAYPGGAWVQER